MQLSLWDDKTKNSFLTKSLSNFAVFSYLDLDSDLTQAFDLFSMVLIHFKPLLQIKIDFLHDEFFLSIRLRWLPKANSSLLFEYTP